MQLFSTHRRFFAAIFLSALLSATLALPRGAQAQAAENAPTPATDARHPLPITTGTATTKMDAGESNNEEEQYTHSATVQYLARHLGISTNRASRYFEDFNSGVLILVVLYYLLKIVPGKFRARREGITRDLVDARKATTDAQERLSRIEAQLGAMGAEVEQMRQQAAASGQAEEARIHASLEAEKQRIVRSAGEEIQAAQAAAERGLKRYASDLAVDRATEQVKLSPGDDLALIDEFLQGLAGNAGLRGKN